MTQKLLVPLDGSRFAERVLAHLLPVATALNSPVLLVRVISSVPPVAAPEPWMCTPPPATERENAERYLRGVQGELRAQGIRATTQVVEGDTVLALCEVAERERVGLIAMATHGRSGVSRWALGSVADHLVRIAPHPVLLVRATMESPTGGTLRRILVPLDGSPLSEEAIPQARALAEATGASLILVRAVEMQTERELDGIMVPSDGPNLLRAQRGRAAGHYLLSIQERLQTIGIPCSSFVIHQPPAQAILTVAEHEEADLIVMSTHARAGLGRWVHGSVADGVLLGATCPLLLVRGGETGAGLVWSRLTQAPLDVSGGVGV